MTNKYLVEPIDVLEFDAKFRGKRHLAGCVLVAFTQTPTTWRVVYQDNDTSMAFSGTVIVAKKWLVSQ